MRSRRIPLRQRRARLAVLAAANLVGGLLIALVVFRTDSEDPEFATRWVKIYLNSPAVQGWNEIDAVGLIGADGSTQWAVSVEASSSYDRRHHTANLEGVPFKDGILLISLFAFPHGQHAPVYQSAGAYRGGGAHWGIEQAAGPPNTQGHGDIVTAWASAAPDNQREWLMLSYEKAVVPAAVEIHETFNPGAVDKVTFFTSKGKEILGWEGKASAPMLAGRRTFRVPIEFGEKSE